MYAVIRRYEGVERETLLEVARRSHAGFRARLMDRPGFVAYEFVVGDDSVAAISVFESGWWQRRRTSLHAGGCRTTSPSSTSRSRR